MTKAPTPAFLPTDAWLGIVRSLRLSQREAEIAQLLLGNDNREDEIAATLAISPHTVHTHLERLYRKLGVTNRSQVVVRIFEQYVMLATNHGRRSPARRAASRRAFATGVKSRGAHPQSRT